MSIRLLICTFACLHIVISSSCAQLSIDNIDFLSKAFFIRNRQALRANLPARSAAIFFSAPVCSRSGDVDFPYHQQPDLYYLTGYTEPDAALLVLSDSMVLSSEKSKIKSNEFLFIRKRDTAQERWKGKRPDPEDIRRQLGIETLSSEIFLSPAINYKNLNSLLQLPYPKVITHVPGDSIDLYNLVAHFDQVTSKVKKDTLLPFIMAVLRQRKSDEELMLIRKAIHITCDAQIELLKSLTANMKEYQAQALVEYVFKNEGAESVAYLPILGSGENACILHYDRNRKNMRNGELLVSDVGAEYHGYCADVTRTLPVSGKFSEEQKVIYQLVLNAQLAGIAACKPGSRFAASGQIARDTIAAGLKRLGIIKNDSQTRTYFPHGTSHYLGLDVHDAGLYDTLEAGNVVTIEPGIYIPAGADCDKKWWNIGVRIEDDVLITKSGHEVLSDCIPKKPEEIEAIMGKPASR